MGWVLVGLCLIGLLGMGLVLTSRVREDDRWRIRVQVEQVDLVEGASIVEQHKSGRERWRSAEVIIPKRVLTFEERMALDRIQGSRDPQVRIKRSKGQ